MAREFGLHLACMHFLFCCTSEEKKRETKKVKENCGQDQASSYQINSHVYAYVGFDITFEIEVKVI